MNSLLHFVAELYQQPGIETQCLAWQDRHGADVPLLLFICWYSVRHGRLSLTALRELIRESRALSSEVVEPLRCIRRQMKRQHVPASRNAIWQRLREQVKQTELRAEFQVLEHLWETVSEHAPSGTVPPPLSAAQQLLELNLRDWHHNSTLLNAHQTTEEEMPTFAGLVTAALRLASASPNQDPDQTDPACAQRDDQ